MNKIRSISDLEAIKEANLKRKDSKRAVIRICNTGCHSRGSERIVDALERVLGERGLRNEVEIKRTGCHGFCEEGPVMVIEPENIFYCRIKADDAPEIVGETIIDGRAVERLLWKDPATGKAVKLEKDIPFYRKQKKIVSHNCGVIDPTDIEDYIGAGGYMALARAVTGMIPSRVVDTVAASGIRGRGGAGFPAGIKWRICSNAPGATKYMIANADEGDPGAFMDRVLMEGDPHSIIEGLAIGAYAIGSAYGYIYVREEYPIAIEYLKRAIEQAEEYGLLGDAILGSAFSFRIRMNKGAGAYVCGEETALMVSIEGKSGTPRSRPPYPAIEGLFGKPSVLNNVETLSNIPLILTHGPEWYSTLGTKGSKGTKIFSVVGKVRNTGVVEVEMGTTLREIIFGIGGGVKDGHSFKAVQTGGPSGGCIPISKIDMAVDYDSLRDAGAIMGSGGMIVMDETTCMVDVARFFIDFLAFESCGKCTPCREGLRQMQEILSNICEGQGREGDIELLMELSGIMRSAALCALGGTAPSSVLSTIRYFRNEYEAHIFDKTCPAGVCKLGK